MKLAENGNLLDYLHLHRVKSGTENNLNPETDLTYGDKLGLVHGIAKGMRHLESIKVSYSRPVYHSMICFYEKNV